MHFKPRTDFPYFSLSTVASFFKIVNIGVVSFPMLVKYEVATIHR